QSRVVPSSARYAAGAVHLVHTVVPPIPSPVFYTRTATTDVYTLSLHDALPIYDVSACVITQCFRKSVLILPGRGTAFYGSLFQEAEDLGLPLFLNAVSQGPHQFFQRACHLSFFHDIGDDKRCNPYDCRQYYSSRYIEVSAKVEGDGGHGYDNQAFLQDEKCQGTFPHCSNGPDYFSAVLHRHPGQREHTCITEACSKAGHHVEAIYEACCEQSGEPEVIDEGKWYCTRCR